MSLRKRIQIIPQTRYFHIHQTSSPSFVPLIAVVHTRTVKLVLPEVVAFVSMTTAVCHLPTTPNVKTFCFRLGFAHSTLKLLLILK